MNKSFDKKKYRRDYYWAHRELIAQKKSLWRKNHRLSENLYKREYRHRTGQSKKYIIKYGGIKTSKSKREYRLLYKYNFRNAGKLSVGDIQAVYEENIKEFGTLTCIYCLNPITFGNDSLEHIIPLSRGGRNDRDNLAIACLTCNKIKSFRLIDELIKQGEK